MKLFICRARQEALHLENFQCTGRGQAPAVEKLRSAHPVIPRAAEGP